ncbi:MAG: cytochrome c [Candidatus Binatia bacterium]
MRKSCVRLVVLLALSVPATDVVAQEQDEVLQVVVDAGRREFQRSCASCHGEDAKGNGPVAAMLWEKPADLTQMSARHGGVFLFWRTYEKISGEDEVVIRGHGTREMPIWGERFRFDRNAGDGEKAGVRGRILSLVHYLQSIQTK